MWLSSSMPICRCLRLCLCACLCLFYVGVSACPFSHLQTLQYLSSSCTNHFCLDPTLDGRDQIQTTALSAAGRQAGELRHSGGCPEAGGSGEGEGLAIAQIYILFLPHSARVTDEPERIGGPEVTR